MNNQLVTIEEAKKLINEKKHLFISADEKVLKQLPKGSWIGGSIPYFVAQGGGEFSQDKAFVTIVPDFVTKVEVKEYNASNIKNVYSDMSGNMVGMIIIPALTKTHVAFAVEAPMADNFSRNPLIGWVSGLNLNDLGKYSAKIINGNTGTFIEDGALVMQLTLPKNKVANVDIINIFAQGKGDTVEFLKDGFSASEALVNGKKVNFSEYVTSGKLDVKLPLVADYCGANVNVAFQTVGDKDVSFYGPVFKNMVYKQAAPIGDYVTEFTKRIAQAGQGKDVAFSCNCVLNYMYLDLEKKKTGHFMGPATFGEIAYQLLTQTMVYLTIDDV
ncbi:MAG: hypothetical protein H7235_06170 [Bdellovibrionaceae bacterium]|nr:hypothetical protein [Pseudobdellovibrionaceae bacterium]